PAHGDQGSALTSSDSQAASATTGSFSCSEVGEIPLSECDALVTLYNSTTGANWTKKSGWLASNTPCSWYGISCTTGRVSSINLSSNNLKGTIPSAVGSFPALTVLNLRANLLSGSIPSEIGNLTAVTQLTLSENQLTGPIPASVGNLVNMTAFWLHYNQLSGSLPAQMGSLTKLKRFGAIDNRLDGTIP
ncbi:MAG TPA: hypothetical protein PKE45_14050, partial [Caldilineaceae bacterium]|nr:hypothetical protein [Caldilineaceae bacterium]